jgi:hypothetical protein
MRTGMDQTHQPRVLHFAAKTPQMRALRRIRTGINDVERKPLLSLLPACLLALSALSCATLAAAQDNDLDRCAELESDAARLACFDTVIKERRAEPPPSAEPAAAPAPDVPDTPDTAAAPQAAAEPGPVTETAAPEKPARANEPKREYTAVVTAMRTRPYGEAVVTLDNGETWSEQYASHGFLVEVGDTVTMKKGRFSSAYRLVAPGGRAYTMVRIQQ